MLPYNTGKYHETPDGIPMIHAVDHGLTETMLSLSPCSQFMYEPELVESTTCGQSQGSTGHPAFELNPGEDFLKSEDIISPTVEAMTFQDCVDPDELFSSPSDGLVFNGCLELNQSSAISTPGMIFDDGDKQEATLYGSDKELAFTDSEKLQLAIASSLENMSYSGGQITDGCFDMLSDGISFIDRDKQNPLIPSSTEASTSNVEGIGNDWFEFNKDLIEMSKDTDILLKDSDFSGGPTLTQLNSKDLDSTSLDDYNIFEDLYANTFSPDKLHNAAPSPGINLPTVPSKFPTGISGSRGAVTSPKFTTCTVTSFVTSMSTSGMTLPQYPSYVANELLVNQGPCHLGGGVQDVKRELLAQNQLASLFATNSTMMPVHTSPCFVPVLRNRSHVDDLVGAVVVTCGGVGGGAASLMVSEEATKTSVQPLGKIDSSNNFPEENWNDIEHLLCSANGGRQMAARDANSDRSQMSVKIEPYADVNMNSQELSDKESEFEDSDMETAEVDNSDEDSLVGKSDNLDSLSTSSRKEKKYFWQYNTQLKGPKGKRLCKSVETEDPHVLHDFEDPVFDPEQNQTRYKHNGKARRGDGNDVTPNPYKLYLTGNELKKLNKLINDIMPSNEMPASARAKLLKEKNKYASRACRLKKKAQHEANKLKLHGLELEHRQLMKVLVNIKKEVLHRVRHRDDLAVEGLSSKLETLVNKHLTLNVAGRSADYVNSVLLKVAKGDRTGGITLDD